MFYETIEKTTTLGDFYGMFVWLVSILLFGIAEWVLCDLIYEECVRNKKRNNIYKYVIKVAIFVISILMMLNAIFGFWFWSNLEKEIFEVIETSIIVVLIIIQCSIVLYLVPYKKIFKKGIKKKKTNK